VAEPRGFRRGRRAATPARHGRRQAGAAGGASLGFARVDGESSVLRWFMSRHGEAVLGEFPGLLARLAQGAAAVALVFEADRAVGLVAWRATGQAEAELLADSITAAAAPQAMAAFVYGPAGPLAAAGISRVWAVAESKPQSRRLRAAGLSPDRGSNPDHDQAPGPAVRAARRFARAVDSTS
jgi:hypothetical protein